MKIFISCLVVVFLFSSCSSSKKNKATNTTHTASDINELVKIMSGTFSSAQQAKKDSDYFNISLVMVPIWAEREDGKWLYVEQAFANRLDKPYRQRVYHLQNPAQGIYTSDMYTIKDALSFAGAQNDSIKMSRLSFDKLEYKDGCTVTLTKHGNSYEGGTTGNKCPSDIRGAKYATTKIKLRADELISWDQGFDDNGKQTWGSTKGGYIFKKK